MKKIIIFIFIIISIISSVSCSEFKEGIEKSRGTKIKNLSIQSCQITNDFWAYTKDGINVSNSIEELGEKIKKNNEEIDDIGFEIRWLSIKSWSMSTSEFNKTKSDLKDKLQAKRDSIDIFKDSLNTLSKQMDSLTKEKQTGILYVARFVEKNEFGKWNKRNTYMVFTIEPNGEYINYSEHRPYESLQFVYKAFPEMVDYVKKIWEH